MSDQQLQEDQYVFPYHWNLAPDAFRGRSYHGYLSLATALAGELKGKIVLDAGCGDGFLCSVLHKKGAIVTGTDYSQQALRLAGILLPADVELVQIDLTKATPEPRFDFIFLIEVLEHIDPKDINVFLKNLSAGLKEGGKIILSVPSKNQALIDKHFQHFTEESLTRVITEAGLTAERIIGQEDMSPIKRLAYKLIDNRLWDIKVLRKFYNTRFYPRFQNAAPLSRAGRLICLISR